MPQNPGEPEVKKDEVQNNEQAKQMRKQAIEAYQNLKKSALFNNFLASMETLMDPTKNHVMTEILSAGQQAPQANEDMYGLPVFDPELIQPYSTPVLLFKAQQMIAELKKPLPQDMENEQNQKDLYMLSELPRMLMKIGEIIGARNAVLDHSIEGEKYDLEFKEGFSFGDLRIKEFCSNIVDELSKIQLKLYDEGETERTLDAEIQQAEAEKENYKNKQDKLRFDIDEFVMGNDDQVINLGRMYHNGKMDKEPTVVTMQQFKENPELYADDNNYFENLIQGLDDDLNQFSKDSFEYKQKQHTKYVNKSKKINDDHDKFKKDLEERYQDAQNDYDMLSSTALKKQKKFSEFEEYKQYQKSLGTLLNYGESNYENVSFEYFRSIWSPDEFQEKLGDAEVCKSELDLVNKQIEEVTKKQQQSKEALDTAKETVKLAYDFSAKNQNIDSMLQKEDENLAKVIDLYDKFKSGTNKNVMISDIPEELLTTPQLKKQAQHAEDLILHGFNDNLFDCKDYFASKNHIHTHFERIISNIEAAVESSEKYPLKSAKLGIDKDLIDMIKADFAKPNGTAAVAEKLLLVASKMDAYERAVDEDFAAQQIEIASHRSKDLEQQAKEIEQLAELRNKRLSGINDFNSGDFSVIKSKVQKLVTSRTEYLNEIDSILSELTAQRTANVQHRENIDEKRSADIDDKKVNTASANVSAEDLKQYEETVREAEEVIETQNNDLKYLNMLKDTLEKNIAWNTVKAKQSNIEEQEQLLKLGKMLKSRDDALEASETERQNQLKEAKDSYDETVQTEDEMVKIRYDNVNSRKERINQVLTATSHIRRTCRELKESAGKITESKQTIADQILAEQTIVKEQFEAQARINSRREDALLNDVLFSKKKIGLSSPLFRKVKDQITAYQEAKRQAQDGEITFQAYLQRTANLSAVLDEYIATRYTGQPKKTDKGRLRLDYVMALKNCIDNTARDIHAYEEKTRILEARKLKTDIIPKTKLELNQLNQDENIKKEFLDKKIDEATVGNDLPELTSEQKTAFVKENEEADIADKINEQKKAVNILMQAQDFVNKYMDEELIKQEKAKQPVVHPEKPDLHFATLAELDPTWEAEKMQYPAELIGVVNEFYNIITKVPKDYGFEEYNKDRNWFTSVSLEKYEQKNMGIKKFMEDYHLRNPKITKEQAQEIMAFNAKMIENGLDLNFGYTDYFVNFAKEHKGDRTAVPLTFHQFVADKFHLKNSDPQTIFQYQIDCADKLARQLKIEDPRSKIANYGSMMDDKYRIEIAMQQLAKANEMTKARAKIEKEIADYDKKVAKIKPDYEFDKYLATKNIITKEDYIKKGLGKLRYMEANNLKNPKDEFRRKKIQPTPEQQKQIDDFEKDLEKHKDFDYKVVRDEQIASARKEYIASNAGVERYIAKHKMVDPRMKYFTEIGNDMILAQKYRPEIVQQMDVDYVNMKQLDESDMIESYEDHVLDIVNHTVKHREIEEEAVYNPLSDKIRFDDPNNPNYYAGFEKYPEDLKPKIKEYDKIMSRVDSFWGYNDFEKNVDYFGRISFDEYVEKGFARKYFAQKYQLVDPRIPLEKAELIRLYDEDIKYCKTQDEINAHEIKYHVSDPRLEIENYGRLVLKKADYKFEPFFDDSERIERNKQIVKEVGTYMEKMAQQTDPLYGYDKYIKGLTDPKDFVTKKEYCLQDIGSRMFMLENKIDNPVVKYDRFVSKDPELRAQIREATAEQKKAYLEQKKEFESLPKYADDAEKKLAEKRDAELAKIQAAEDAYLNSVKENHKAFYKKHKIYMMNQRAIFKQFEDDPEGLTQANLKTITKLENNFQDMLSQVEEYDSVENYQLIKFKASVKRYCDNLTEDSIDSELDQFKEHSQRLEEDELERAKDPSKWRESKLVSVEDKYFFGERQKRVIELIQDKEARLLREKQIKERGEKLSNRYRNADMVEDLLKHVEANKQRVQAQPEPQPDGPSVQPK